MCSLLFLLLGLADVITSPLSAASNVTTTTVHLSAPKASTARDDEFFADVTEADSSLVKYEKNYGNVALRSLLTVGSAFCAFLERDSGIDQAMVDVAVGAQSDESTTRLPMSVRTFNAIEAVALLTLCPSLQDKLPAADRAKIRALGKSFPTLVH